MARYLKKRPATKRRTLKRKAPVSQNIKTYVDRKVRNTMSSSIQDSYAVESSVGTLSIWYMDDFMIMPTWIPGSQPLQSSEGKKLYSKGLKVKYNIHSNSTDVPLGVRMLVIENLRGNCNLTDYRSGLNLFEYHPYDGSANTSANINGTTANLVWRINDELFKVHYDRIIQFGISNDQAPGGRNNVGSVWVPYKRVMKYDNESTIDFPQRSNLVVLFIPIEQPNDTSTGRTVEITAVGSWYFSYK